MGEKTRSVSKNEKAYVRKRRRPATRYFNLERCLAKGMITCRMGLKGKGERKIHLQCKGRKADGCPKKDGIGEEKGKKNPEKAWPSKKKTEREKGKWGEIKYPLGSQSPSCERA